MDIDNNTGSSGNNSNNSKDELREQRINNIKPHWFAKGQSGNPSGRPKLVAECKDKALKYSLDAIERAIKIFQDDKESTKHRLDAIKIILGYGLGKPTQQITVDGEVKHGLTIMVSKEVAALYASPDAIMLDEGEYGVD